MITMTSPRKTSTETKRGACARRERAWALTAASAGELAALTASTSGKQESMVRIIGLGTSRHLVAPNEKIANGMEKTTNGKKKVRIKSNHVRWEAGAEPGADS